MKRTICTRTRWSVRTAMGICLLSFAGGIPLKAAIDLDWARQSKAGFDGFRNLALDNSGNTYTIGSFSGTVDFDPGAAVYHLSAAGDQDVFITKMDASGNFVWAKSIGGSSTETPRSLHIDHSGHLYICGSFFSSNFDADPGSPVALLSRTGTQDGFIVKLNADGNLVWAKQVAGPAAEVTVQSVSVDGSGNVYAAGQFTATTDFDPGSGSNELTAAGSICDAFISKLDASGNFLWARQFKSDEFASIAAVSADAAGNVFAYGCFESEIDCDPGAASHSFSTRGLMDLFALKLDAGGHFAWAAHAGGTEPDWPRGLDIDAAGNTYLTGTFDGNADFDPEGAGYVLMSVGSTSNPDVFTMKLNNDGSFGWVKQFGSTSPDGGGGIKVDAAGNIYTAGNFVHLMDADPGPDASYLTSLSEDGFITKLNSSGDFLWAGAIAAQRAGFAHSRFSSITVDKDEHILATGFFNDTVDFDPGTPVYTMASIEGPNFLMKLKSSTVSIPEPRQGSIVIVPNPATDLVRISLPEAIQNGQVRLTDLGGRVVISATAINGNSSTLNLSGLPAGEYILELQDGNRLYSARITHK